MIQIIFIVAIGFKKLYKSNILSAFRIKIKKDQVWISKDMPHKSLEITYVDDMCIFTILDEKPTPSGVGWIVFRV